MKKLCLSAFVFGTSLFIPSAARGDVVVNITETATDIQVAASGSIDLTGLGSSFAKNAQPANIRSNIARFFAGPIGTNSDPIVGYSITRDFLGGFGSAGQFNALSGSTNVEFGVVGSAFAAELLIDPSYVSGTAISSNFVYDKSLFSSLTEGTYVYSWGSGSNADSLTINIAQIPEPSSLALVGIAAGVGVCLRRKRRAVQANAV